MSTEHPDAQELAAEELETQEVETDDPSGQNRALVLLAGSLVLAMSTWFSTSAILGQLRLDWGLSDLQGAWLAIAVQLGFVAGAVASALTGIADRVNPRRLVLYGSALAGVANALLVIAGGFVVALPLRFLTGAALAAVYPPAMKAMAGWFRKGRGFALGAMIGGLTLGSALPHLINGIGGLRWQVVVLATSALTVAGGLIADQIVSDGPYKLPVSPFEPSQVRSVCANRKFQLACLGYFGHMWELYAMWAWFGAFAADRIVSSQRAASLLTFAVIGVGAFGSIVGGRISDARGRNVAAGVSMLVSGSIASIVGFVSGPTALIVVLALLWGFWVVADSAQFSTIVTEEADQRYIGTALTIQIAAGFVLSVFTIFLVPIVSDSAGWGWAFLLLAPGPFVGVLAMYGLSRQQP